MSHNSTTQTLTLDFSHYLSGLYTFCCSCCFVTCVWNVQLSICDKTKPEKTQDTTKLEIYQKHCLQMFIFCTHVNFCEITKKKLILSEKIIRLAKIAIGHAYTSVDRQCYKLYNELNRVLLREG